MAINSVSQTIKNAEIDARSLSEFMYEPADAMVSRRLAPSIHSLQYYLDFLDTIPSIVQNAIDNTAIEGSVLADTFVVVDGSLSQRTINRGLESIADLSTIKNPKNGLRVYVKSYHAGLSKGGGYFTYDELKASEDNGGTVINGWVRELAAGEPMCITYFGAKVDGISDDTQAIQSAISNNGGRVVVIPSGTACISDTIRVGLRSRHLAGVNYASPNVRQGDALSILKWIGDESPRKTMLLLGSNEVGAEPTIDGSRNSIRNVMLDGDYKVGFLIYGTYLTNETVVEGVAGTKSLEYNFYFAKGWYATIKDITSHRCKNNGIALGMPLVYSDGERVSWTTSAPLELNSVPVSNIRSWGAGQSFVSGEKQWSSTEANLWQGYGIGVGAGYGLSVTGFTSERSGGVNLYSWGTAQENKLLQNGYLEGANQGRSGGAEVGVYLDYSEASFIPMGHKYVNIYSNPESGGRLLTKVPEGYTHNSFGGMVVLDQVWGLSGIRSQNTNGTSLYAAYDATMPFNWIRFVNSTANMYRANKPDSGVALYDGQHNTRYSFSLEAPETLKPKVLYMKLAGETVNPESSWSITQDGSSNTYAYPSELNSEYWIPVRVLSKGEVTISRAGPTTTKDIEVQFRVFEGS